MRYVRISKLSLRDMWAMCADDCALCPLSFEGGRVCMGFEKAYYLNLKRRKEDTKGSKYECYRKNEIGIEEEPK